MDVQENGTEHTTTACAKKVLETDQELPHRSKAHVERYDKDNAEAMSKLGQQIDEFLADKPEDQPAWLEKFAVDFIKRQSHVPQTKLLTDEDFKEYLPPPRTYPRVPFLVPDNSLEWFEFKIDTHRRDSLPLCFKVPRTKFGNYRTICETLRSFETAQLPVVIPDFWGAARCRPETEENERAHTLRVARALKSIRDFYETIEDETRTRTIVGPPAPRDDWDDDGTSPLPKLDTIQDSIYVHGCQEPTSEDMTILLLAPFEREFFGKMKRVDLFFALNVANHVGAEQYIKCASKFASEYCRYLNKAAQLLPPGAMDLTKEQILSISLLQYVWLMVEYGEGRLPADFSLKKALEAGEVPESDWTVPNPRWPYKNERDADLSLQPEYDDPQPDEDCDDPFEDEQGKRLSRIPHLADVQGERVLDIARFFEWAHRRSHKNLEQVIDVWQGKVYKPLHANEDEEYFLSYQPKIIEENYEFLSGKEIVMQGVKVHLRVGDPAFEGSTIVTQDIYDQVKKNHDDTVTTYAERMAAAPALYAKNRAEHEELAVPYRAYKAQIRRLFTRLMQHVIHPQFDELPIPDCVPWDFFGQAADTNYWNPSGENHQWFLKRVEGAQPMETSA